MESGNRPRGGGNAARTLVTPIADITPIWLLALSSENISVTIEKQLVTRFSGAPRKRMWRRVDTA